MHDKSLLLYARAYDLVEDHTSISPLSFVCLPHDGEGETINNANLISSFLQHLQFQTSVHPSTNERLEAVKDVSSSLAKTISLRICAESPEDEYQQSDDLHLDEPLLRYQASLPANTISPWLDLNRLPLKKAVPNDKDDEDGEGLQFPRWLWERQNEIVGDIAGERMAIDRKVLEYLRKTVKDPDHGRRSFGEHADDHCYDGPNITNLKETTPPLSPLCTPASPLSSISLNELAERLKPLNLKTGDNLPSILIFKDGDLRNETLDEDLEAIRLSKSIQLPPLINSSPARSPAKEFRVEAPLTPPLTSPNKQTLFSHNMNESHLSSQSRGPVKRVKFSNIVEEFLIPPSLDPSEDGYDDEASPGDYLTHSAMAQFTLGVMEPGAQFFLMQMQQEQLEDSTKSEQEPQNGLRVELPVVNWQRPTPPWVSRETFDEESIGGIDKEVIMKWEYRSLDIAGLCWTIRSKTGSQPGVTETIFPESEEELWKGIEEVFPVLPLETVIEDEDESFWEDGPQEDKDLECAKIPPNMDLDSLIERKRLRRPTANRKNPAISLLGPRSNLSSFLSLRNRAIEPPFGPLLHSSSAVLPSAPSPLSCLQTDPPTVQPSTEDSSVPSDPSSTFIVSASFLANRALYKAIRSFCPTSKFVERDFESFSCAKMFGKQDQVPDEYTLEADIIVSPLTGIILTDLQTIRKRPLPANFASASDNSSPRPCEEIRDRISESSRRYQSLVVVVSIDFGGRKAGLVELGTTDCAILAAFIGFCERIGNVEVTIVPANGRSGVQEVGKWVVNTMNFHSMQWRNAGLEVEITEKESMWETFLRNSGMNSYAAQAVLTKLHESGCGLADFVTVEKESRRVIFEQFVGEKNLERFEEVSDAKWQCLKNMNSQIDELISILDDRPSYSLGSRGQEVRKY
ncbi:uncharacterized protein DFL_005812 [Arthrobotrys flagrans]|uniref:Uncharacterized protein n=1 Tax=Arthrobotrys flagrans TaxID=97331 RepID=A0A436ZZ93_ARTFL|nr:hypothetical protein DFL_005812 [Arthrobotrys flagrans]